MAKEYYAITTKRFILKTSHDGWLLATRNLYNEILGFYYELYLEHEELYGLNSQNTLRGLERLTIVGRDKMPVPDPLPWEKIPLYFRRAAINEAIAAGKSYLSREKQMSPTEGFSSGVTFYKGMYQDLKSSSVSLKVYDGEKWRWLHCRLSGNTLSDNAECMSPKLVFKDKQTEFHVPVRSSVADGRKLKERMDSDLRICGLQFTNNDALAVSCIMDYKADVKAVKFFRGGRQYQARCKGVLEDIQNAGMAMSRKTVSEPKIVAASNASDKTVMVLQSKDLAGTNRRYWKKLRNISEDMAHQVSRQILDVCEKEQVSVIVLPKYSERYTRMVMDSSGKWSPLRLSRRIIEKLGYKAWQSGILMVEIEASDIARYCAVCGCEIKRNGEEFSCKNNHKGNRHVNSARNLGKKFLTNMQRK